MIKNWQLVREVEDEYNANLRETFDQKLKLLNELYAFARSLGHFRSLDDDEGIEVDIRIAQILREHVRRTPKQPG